MGLGSYGLPSRLPCARNIAEARAMASAQRKQVQTATTTLTTRKLSAEAAAVLDRATAAGLVSDTAVAATFAAPSGGETPIGPCPWYEEHGSPEEEWSVGAGLRAVVTLRCSWHDRYDLASYYIGTLYDRVANKVACPCRHISIRPAPGGSLTDETSNISSDGTRKRLIYEFALVTLTYDSNPNSAEGNALYTETIEPVTEFIQLDYRDFYWSSGENALPLREGEAPGLLLRTFDYQCTFYNVVQFPTSLLYLPGCCNSNVIASRNMHLWFNPETLLFCPPRISKSFKWGAQNAWEVSAAYTCKPWGWNRYFNPRAGDSGEWGEIFHKDSEEPFQAYTPSVFPSGLIP